MKQAKRSKDIIKKMIDDVLSSKDELSTEKYSKNLEDLLDDLSVYHFKLENQNDELLKIQQELDNTNYLLNDLFENAPCGYFITDNEMIITSVNNTFSSMIGIKKDKLINHSLENIIDKNSIADFRNHVKCILNNDNSTNYLINIIGMNRIIPCKIKSRIYSNNNQILIRSAVIDISNEKDVTDKLNESEERFRLMFDKAPLGYQSLDINGYFIDINQAWLDTLGYSREEVIGKWFGDFLSGKYVDGFRERFPIFKALGSIHSEFEMVHKNGNILFISFEGRIAKDNSGEFKQTHCILQDITDRKKAEEALHASEERYRALAETVNVINWEFDLKNNKWNYVAPQATAILGYEPSEWKDFEWWAEHVYKEDREYAVNYCVAETKKKTDHTFEYRFIKKDGSIVWLHDIVNVILEDNTPSILRGIIIDLTEKKRAEENLHLSNLLLDSIRVAQDLYISNEEPRKVFMTLLETLVLITNSEYGFLDEILSDSDGSRYKVNLAINDISWDAPSKQLYYELIEQKLEFRNLNNLAGLTAKTGKLVIANDVKTDSRSGGVPHGHPPLHTFMGLPIEFGGELLGVAGVANRKDGYNIDMAHWLEPFVSTCGSIIHSVRANKREKDYLLKLQDSVSMMDSILNALPEAAYLIDTDGVILHCNKTISNSFNKNLNDFIGKNIFDYFNAESGNYHKYKINEVIKTTKPVFFEENIDGLIISNSIFPITDKLGKVVKLAIFGEDITERRSMEAELIAAKNKAEEINRLKSNFLANMSHELRTPMNSILGFSDLIAGETDLESIRDMSDFINKSGRRLLDTLNQILDLSSIESGQLKPALMETNIVDVVSNAVALFTVQANAKNLSLYFANAESVIIADTDEKMLRNAVYNLLHNAVKFTESGSITVLIKEKTSNDGNWIEIDVTDTGIGISKEHQQTIFEEFRQVSEGLNRGFEGTGLGLALCKKYTEMIGGEIKLDSELSKGSTFTVRFPKTNKTGIVSSYKIEQDLPKLHNSLVQLTEIINKPKILYVEDDDLNALVASRMLREYYHFERVKNGLDAIQKVKEIDYSVILMDINLGKGMDGLDTITEIRKMPNYMSKPIIAVTAYAMKSDKEEFLAKGCSHYISKPYQKEILIDTIEDALKVKK